MQNSVYERNSGAIGSIERKTVLIFIDYYLPGSRAGGPIQSVANIVSRLSDEFSFFLVTSDRDLGDDVPFSNVPRGVWVPVGSAKVMYIQRGVCDFLKIIAVLRAFHPDVIYVNSLFSRPFSLYVVWVWVALLRRRVPLLVAPRGELGAGALSIKSFKKRVYLGVSAALRFYRGVFWHASSVYEQSDIEASGLPSRRPSVASPLSTDQVIVAPDLVDSSSQALVVPRRKCKIAGEVKLVFLARIVPIKNLDFALRAIKLVNGRVNLSIYGPIEDQRYWRECEQVIASLPIGKTVAYHGSLAHDDVAHALVSSHFYILPSKGENFGHGILEAFSCGLPVIISNKTFWRELVKRGVGWDVSIENEDLFLRALQQAVNMSEDEYISMSEKCLIYASEVAKSEDAVFENRLMFRELVQGVPR